jgi:nucleoside-diphosphate-sugar epimerase
MKVLFVGGTGQISLPCVELAVSAGHDVTVFNRGQRGEPVPKGAKLITGDMKDKTAYGALGAMNWDVVVQCIVFTPDQMQADIDVFSAHVGQYIFISSASVYQKPPLHYVITEATPAVNPYWPYSQAKIACENLMRSSKLPWTNLRPSHTVRTGLPSMMNDGDGTAHRMIAGKPVLVCGDGSTPWTLSRSKDIAKPIVGLFGKQAALREDFHVTSDNAYGWDEIYHAIAKGLGVEAKIVHVPTDTLVAYHPEWGGPLLGDKTWAAVFDNSKTKRVAGDFECAKGIDVVLEESIAHVKARIAKTGPVVGPLDSLMDRIAAEQSALGH